MASRKKAPRVGIKVLPGEPTDGSGKVCIHLFVHDERGLIVEPNVLHPVTGKDGLPIKQQVCARPTRGRLACNPKKLVAPVVKNGVSHITLRTDAAEAVTCPKCKKSKEYLAAMNTTKEK